MSYHHNNKKKVELRLVYRLSLGLSLSFSLIFINPLKADNVRAFISPHSIENLQEKIEGLLKKIDANNFNQEEDSQGFLLRYSNGWFSAYDYNIYASDASKGSKQSLIRIEGDKGDVLSLGRILEIEKIINPPINDSIETKPLHSKYHIFAQPLNLLSPSISIIYQNYASPRLATDQATWRAITYIGLDILAYWIGGTGFFRTRHSPERNREVMLLCLGANRAVGAVQAFNVVRGHNNLLQFGYTFSFY